MAKDESARDKMFLRDAVVNDQIPSITQGGLRRLLRLPLRPRGLRLHRGALGQGGLPRLPLRDAQHPRLAGRPRGRARLPLEPEDFDAEFRRWLRKKYLRHTGCAARRTGTLRAPPIRLSPVKASRFLMPRLWMATTSVAATAVPPTRAAVNNPSALAPSVLAATSATFAPTKREMARLAVVLAAASPDLATPSTPSALLANSTTTPYSRSKRRRPLSRPTKLVRNLVESSSFPEYSD